MKSAVPDKKYARLRYSAFESAELFRSGRDGEGLDAFLVCIGDIENIVNTCVCLEEFGGLDEIYVLLDMLLNAVRNRDVTGITDILEYKVLPLAEMRLKE